MKKAYLIKLMEHRLSDVTKLINETKVIESDIRLIIEILVSGQEFDEQDAILDNIKPLGVES